MMNLFDTPQVVQNFSGLTPDQCRQIQQVLESFSQEHNKLTNMLLATADGFEVAAVLEENDWESIRRLSAMTSSILSIGVAMLQEINAGSHKVLTLEGEKNNVLIYMVPYTDAELVLTIVSSNEETLGQLFWLIRQLSNKISEICQQPRSAD